MWTVVLRDHMRHIWLRVLRVEQLAADEQESAPLVPWERPLTDVALAGPEGAAMTWLQVLWVLGALAHSTRGWSLVGIEASRPAAQTGGQRTRACCCSRRSGPAIGGDLRGELWPMRLTSLPMVRRPRGAALLNKGI